MRSDGSRLSVFLGAIAILLGLVVNKWTVEHFLSPDGHIESFGQIAVIVALQLVLLGSGAALVVRRPALGRVSGKDWALLVASTVVSLGLVEAGLRLWLANFATPEQFDRLALHADVPAKSLRWTRHHYLNYYPTPGYRSGGTSHNSLGYRGREFSRAKPPGTFRIAAIGGSSTYTIAVENDDQSFPSQLQRSLREDHGRDAVEVVNAGVNGFNSWESLVNLQFRVLDLDPDLVIVYHGTNDVHARLVQPSHYTGDNGGRRMPWTPPAVSTIERSLLGRLVMNELGLRRATGLGDFVNAPTYLGAGSTAWPESRDRIEELLARNPPDYFRRNLASMIAVADTHGVAVILATWAHSPHFGDYASNDAYRRGFAQNNQVVKEVAQARSVPLFDFAAAMPDDRQYWADGRHVNEAGARLKAQLFADFLAASGLLPAPGAQ